MDVESFKIHAELTTEVKKIDTSCLGISTCGKYYKLSSLGVGKWFSLKQSPLQVEKLVKKLIKLGVKVDGNEIYNTLKDLEGETIKSVSELTDSFVIYTLSKTLLISKEMKNE